MWWDSAADIPAYNKENENIETNVAAKDKKIAKVMKNMFVSTIRARFLFLFVFVSPTHTFSSKPK